MIGTIVKAYMIRFKAIVKSLSILSLSLGVGVVALAVIPGFLGSELYTPITRQALVYLATKILGIHSTELPKGALGAVDAAIYAPYLSAMVAASVAPYAVVSIFAEDRDEGVFEVLFSAPVTRRSIIITLLIYTLLASLITATILEAAVAGVSLLSLHLLGYLSSLGTYYTKLSIMLVPSSTFSASLTSLALTIIMSSLRRTGTGLTSVQNIALAIPLILSSLPPTILFIILNTMPQTDPVDLALYNLIYSALLALILLPLLPRILKEEALLR